MAGTSRATNENTAADQETLTRSDPAGWKYQSEVNQIGAKIQELLPGAFVQGFAYVRQVKDEYLAKGYGKGAVSTATISSSASFISALLHQNSCP